MKVSDIVCWGMSVLMFIIGCILAIYDVKIYTPLVFYTLCPFIFFYTLIILKLRANDN